MSLAAASPAAAEPVFSPDPVEFSDQLVGTPSTVVEVRVANDGPDPYEISDVFVDGEDAAAFEVVSESCSGLVLTLANDCVVRLRFAPPEAGSWLAVLVLDNATGTDAFGVLVGGFGYDRPPIVAEPTVVEFPPTRVSSTSVSPRAHVTFTNTGEGPAVVGTSISGPDAEAFQVAQGCLDGRLEPGESCTVTVAFRPRRSGAHSASLVLTGDGAVGPVPLSGTGLPQADVRIEPDLLDFGLLAPPFAAISRQVVVRNLAGNAVILRARTSGLFGTSTSITANTCFAAPLAVGASCGFTLSLRPSNDGVFNGRLEVVSGPRRDVLDAVPVTGEVRGLRFWRMESYLRSLLRDVARRWHSAERTTLRRRGFTIRVFPSVGGSLRLTITHAPVGTSAARSRILARGRAAIASDEDVTLRARLTRAGRNLLARPRRLRVRARLAFRADNGQRVVVVRHLRLRAGPE